MKIDSGTIILYTSIGVILFAFVVWPTIDTFVLRPPEIQRCQALCEALNYTYYNIRPCECYDDLGRVHELKLSIAVIKDG